jgi:O-antigen/teichoic acid export membrane protein
VSFGSYLVSALVLLVQIPFLTHVLGARDYGAWVVSGGVAPLFMVLDLGLPYAVNRFVARERIKAPDDAKEAITAGLILLTGIGILISVATALVSEYWANRIDTPAASLGLKIAGVAAAFFLCARLFLSALEGSGSVGASRVLQTASVVGFTLVSVPTVLLTTNRIEALSIAVLGQSVVLTAASAFVLRRVWHGRVPLRMPRWSTSKNVLRYGIVASGSAFLSAIVEPIGRFVLAGIAGPASVAPLDVALRIRGQAFGAASAFLSPVMPAMGEMSAPRDVERYCRPIWRATTPAALAYGCGLAALAWVFAPTLFGAEIGADAGSMSAVAIVLWIPSSIAMLTFLVVAVYGRARDLAYIHAPGSLIALVGVVALVPMMGAWAIIVSTGIGAIIGAFVTVHLARRALGLGSFRYGDVHWPAMIRAAGGSAAVLLLAATAPLPLFAKLLLGASIWLPLSFPSFRYLIQTLNEPISSVR